MSLSSAFHENWTANVTTTRDLGQQSRTLSQGVSLTFTNECFIFANTLTKTFYNDRELRPDLTYMFRISFKILETLRIHLALRKKQDKMYPYFKITPLNNS
jgi:LPS-assembly protein